GIQYRPRMAPVLRALTSDSSDTKVVGKALRATSRTSDCPRAGRRAVLVVPVLPRGLGFSPESSCVWRNWYCRNQSHSPWPDIDEIATVLRSSLPQRVAMRRAQN